MTVLRADIERPPTAKDFASGLLVDLVGALRDARVGALVAFTTQLPVDEDLQRWCRFTGNPLVAATRETDGWRYVVRHGPSPRDAEERPVGSRVWLYTNFDCNLACDYCCVRSSPKTARRALGLERVRRIAREAREAGVEQLFVTGGEPFLLEDIDAIVTACAEAAPTVVLTNGMLFHGRRREMLAAIPRDRVVLQVSLDSPEPTLHDAHRGEGTWEKAWRGVAIARSEGFRVRLAATVSTDEEELAFHSFLDREGIALEDRLVRRVARRGFAEEGVVLTRSDLVPEPTITADGVYWHPVGAGDDDFFVTLDPFPLARAIETVRLAYAEERKFADALASIFFCA